MGNINISHDSNFKVDIKVAGVGGGGGNAINRMVRDKLHGVEFMAINTDNQILYQSLAENKISIGSKTTKGRGAGGDPSLGEKAAEESKEEITAALKGAQMLFLTAGMGGGTGTGAAPVIAKIAKDMDILTIGVVTKPFLFEGPVRMRQAEEGIARLRESVDSLIVVPNERLKMLDSQKITLANAFEAADDVLKQGVKSISELINTSGFINLDFSDVSNIMKGAGFAHMGVASAEGKDKAIIAAENAVSSPLLETSIEGAKGLIINITAPPTIEFAEIDAATNHISQSVDPEANIIFGVAFDEELEDKLKITVIATGFDTGYKEHVRKVSTSDLSLEGNDGSNDDTTDNLYDDILSIFKNKD